MNYECVRDVYAFPDNKLNCSPPIYHDFTVRRADTQLF